MCGLAFAVGLCALTLEIAVRLSGYANQWIYDPIYVPFPQADDLPYIHKPGLEGAFARDRVRINTDSLGNRSLIAGQTYGIKQPGQYRIAVFGDSCTFGHGLRDTANTFPCRLESLLTEGEPLPVQVINFAASAYSVREMTASLRERALPLAPDLALMAIIPDDLNLDRTPDLDRWGFHHNRERSGWIDKDSRFKRILRGVHSVYFIRDHIPLLRPRSQAPPPSPPPPPQESMDYIRSFLRIAATNYIPARIVLLPTQTDKPGARLIRERLEAESLPYIDLSDIADDLTRGEFQVNRYNTHPSAKLHALIAEALAEFVRNEHRWSPQTSSEEAEPDRVSPTQ